MPKTDDVPLGRAKAMRRAMTQPGRERWTVLRGKRVAGVTFSRQVVIGTFIADVAARAQKPVSEVDGDPHSDQSRDDRRTAWLMA